MQKITLKAARINAGLSVEGAAKAIGVNRATILRWEKDPRVVKAEFQKRIEQAYKFPLNLIFFGS